MSLVDAVINVGPYLDMSESRARKKGYAERLSNLLADEVARGLRTVGFPNVKPDERGGREKAFQGGLGPKKVDVSYADERHGLHLAVSVKSICYPPFGKNLKNRFGDLCTEAITLHMRFPYSIVCALFAFPTTADQDVTPRRPVSSFQRARRLLRTISDRQDQTGPGERFENVTVMLFQPLRSGDDLLPPSVRLFDCSSEREFTEGQYFQFLLEVFNQRNPHALIESLDEGEDESAEENGEG
jgi:hypothetical protein